MITTKKGDQGETDLYDGTRVGKDDLRIELNGQLDELNALLGLCKAATRQTEPYEHIQKELMTMMAIVANGYEQESGANALSEALNLLAEATASMESHIHTATHGRKFDFVLPGKTVADGFLHLARTQTRTCERRLVALARMITLPDKQPQYDILKQYLNRLSDFLFCLCIQ